VIAIFTKANPMSVCPLSADMTEYGVILGKFQYFRYLYIGLIPLEDKKSTIFKHSETFGKTTS
jgi:hypothetical protein